MSLNYDFTGIDGYETVCWITDDEGNKVVNPITDALVWATLSIGIGEITAANVNEWHSRLWAMDAVYGPSLYNVDDDGNRTPRPITVAEIRAHVGLSTNVFPKVTAITFARKLAEHLYDRARLARESEAREAAATVAS